MTFTVDPNGLEALPTQLDRLARDARSGNAYVNTFTRLSYGGLLNDITGAHTHAVSEVTGFLDKLAGPVAGNTADAIRAANTYYRQTDANAAAKLDSTYLVGESSGKPESQPTGDYRATVGPFCDAAEPCDHYRPLQDYSAEFSTEPKPLETISVAGFVRGLIVEAITLASKLGLGYPWDPYEEILKPVTGDWKGLRGCADVFDTPILAQPRQPPPMGTSSVRGWMESVARVDSAVASPRQRRGRRGAWAVRGSLIAGQLTSAPINSRASIKCGKPAATLVR